MLFIKTISSHFSSPQNKARLRNLQRENKLKVLTPKKLALTRWLSLVQVLERILDIWSSLLKYFVSITDEKLGKG